MATVEGDGVKLFYEETGAGDPPFLFVHGWTCNHTYFAPQFDHFGRGHRVVTIDLRGHGQSDVPADEPAYAIGAFADDLAAACRNLGLERPVVVGHSMGGVIALELAARHPDIPGAVVMVDPAPIVMSPELTGLLNGLVDALHGPDHEATRRGFVEGMLFLPTDDAALRARVVAEMLSVPKHVAAGAFTGIASWDGVAALRACTVPALLLVADNPIVEPAVLRAIKPDLMTGQTVGAGHFHQLLVPDQISAMIDRFVEVALTPTR